MAKKNTRPRGVIFDYGSTLIWLGPNRLSRRTDYADIVARPGAERLSRFLVREGVLAAGKAALEFEERFLAVREADRLRAEDTGREAAAFDSLAAAVTSLGMPPLSEDQLRRGVAENFGPEIEAAEPLPGANETLDFLRGRGVSLALLSNCTDGPYVATVVGRLGWADVFDPFVVSSDIGYRKPLPEAFQPIVHRWPFERAEIVMIGDSLYHDVAGAQRLGMRAIHLTAIENPGDPTHRASVRPDWAVTSHAELRDVLGKLLD